MQAEGRALIGSMFPKRANNLPSVINSGDYTTKLVRVAENDEKLSIFKGVPQSSMLLLPMHTHVCYGSLRTEGDLKDSSVAIHEQTPGRSLY